MTDEPADRVRHFSGTSSRPGPPYVTFHKGHDEYGPFYSLRVSIPPEVLRDDPDLKSLNAAMNAPGALSDTRGLNRLVVEHFGYTLSPVENELLDRYGAADTGADFWAAVDAAGLWYIPPEEREGEEPGRRGRSDLIAFTFPPVVALEQAVADGAAGVHGNFALVDSNRRMIHTRDKAGYQVAVDYVDAVASVDVALREIGARNGLEAVFAVAAACYHALEHEGEEVHVDDVLLDIGWQRDRDGKREERAEAVERTARLFLILNGWNVIGDSWGLFKDKDGAHIDVSSRGPLFTTTVLDDPQGTLLGRPTPVGFIWRRGDFLARVAEYPHVLATFGTYRELARLPRQRPADAWAVAIGLALVQRWRESARHAKVTKPGEDNLPAIRVQKVKRRYLLAQYPPQPDPVDVLADKEHGTRNAKTYWTKAIHTLRAAGVIDEDVERRLAGDPKKLPRRGWGDAWLDEPLDIRPPAGYQTDFLTLADRAETHRKKTRRRKPPKP